MNGTRLLCLASIGLLLAGCGGPDKPPSGEEASKRYFADKRPVPKDRTLRLAADPALDHFHTGATIAFTVMISNMTDRERAVPLGVETDDGRVYPFFSALVCDEAGRIERVEFPAPDEAGPVVWLELGPYETASELIPIGSLGEPGEYRVVLFYSVEEGKVPGERQSDWTGTVWASPIGITIE